MLESDWALFDESTALKTTFWHVRCCWVGRFWKFEIEGRQRHKIDVQRDFQLIQRTFCVCQKRHFLAFSECFLIFRLLEQKNSEWKSFSALVYLKNNSKEWFSKFPKNVKIVEKTTLDGDIGAKNRLLLRNFLYAVDWAALQLKRSTFFKKFVALDLARLSALASLKEC